MAREVHARPLPTRVVYPYTYTVRAGQPLPAQVQGKGSDHVARVMSGSSQVLGLIFGRNRGLEARVGCCVERHGP